jgi:putative endonuclease
MGTRSTRPVGQRGEALAARYLERRGYEILARNLRSRLGEIDLVAREGRTLVFVEVKARRGRGGDPPQAAVDGRKQARLARLAGDYLARTRGGERACRFDVVAVTFEGEEAARLEHFRGAFAVDGWAG